MYDSKQEASSRRRSFMEEFKQDAVRLLVEEHYSFKAAGVAVGGSDRTLRTWHARFAPQPLPCGENASVDELRHENLRMRKQLRREEMERNILK